MARKKQRLQRIVSILRDLSILEVGSSLSFMQPNLPPNRLRIVAQYTVRAGTF
jgi:hypothetical protein